MSEAVPVSGITAGVTSALLVTPLARATRADERVAVVLGGTDRLCREPRTDRGQVLPERQFCQTASISQASREIIEVVVRCGTNSMVGATGFEPNLKKSIL